jgi:hypothetical protein
VARQPPDIEIAAQAIRKKAGAMPAFFVFGARRATATGCGKKIFALHETFTVHALLCFPSGLADKQTCVLLR